MKSPAIVLAATFLLAAAPSYAQHGGGHSSGGHASGGHSSGGRASGSSGGHVGGSSAGHSYGVAPAVHGSVGSHSAPSYAPAVHGPAVPASRLDTGHVSFVPPPPGMANGFVKYTPPVVRVGEGFAATRPRPAVPPRPSGIMLSRPSLVPMRPMPFLGSSSSSSHTAFLFLGNGLFPDPFTAELFFIDPFALEEFGPNVFCPFCAFGRVDPFFPPGFGFGTPFFSPFGPQLVFRPIHHHHHHRRVFFGAFFFDGFGFGPVFSNTADLSEQELAGQAPVEPVSELPPSETYLAPPAEQVAGVAEQASLPLTLLVFKDGSMYGVTDYWLEDGQLHYLTNYGGENSVAVDRVDLDTTAQMNWDRGNPFVLRPGPEKR